MVPGKATQRVPVGLTKGMARPVDIAAYIGHTGHTRKGVGIGGSINDLRYGTAIVYCMRICIQHFFKQRRLVNKVRSKTQVFLCKLVLHHQRCLRHSAKQRMKRFAWLKIYGTVLYLYQYIFSELP